MKDVVAVIRERDYKITGVALQDGVCVEKRPVKWSFCQKFSEKDSFFSVLRGIRKKEITLRTYTARLIIIKTYIFFLKTLSISFKIHDLLLDSFFEIVVQ